MNSNPHAGKLKLVSRLHALFSFEFARRVHEGTPGTFEAVYQRFRHPIRNWMNRRIPDPQLSEELTQEVFLKAWRSRELFHPAFEFSSWLWSIARHILIDNFRKRTSLYQSKEDPFPLIEALEDPGENPESALGSEIERGLLRRSLDKLTDQQKKALVLRVVEHLSYQEIAEQLNLSLSAVKSLIHRARTQMLEASEPLT